MTTNQELVFASFPSQVYVNISIVTDMAVEEQEMFMARLTTTDSSVMLAPDIASISILDNTGR